ncbi:SNARE-associated protein Snapin-like [Dysidea avara]|uniref:SNARE-associated protein Snapin-like n=1 Tax=Dysidea avara TaxID=196820 RepID=UPI00331D78EE
MATSPGSPAATTEENVSTEEDVSDKPEDKPVEKPDIENAAASLVGSGSTDYTLDANTNVDELATGILGLLSPAVEEVNERVNDVRKSQSELRGQIDKLADELRQLSDQQKVPVDLETYIQKLSNSKRRVTIVNEILQNVQDRLTKLHNNVSKETVRRKAIIEATTH